MKISIQEWIAKTQIDFADLREYTTLEIYSILSFVLGEKREWIITHGETFLTESQLTALNERTQRLKMGEPLPYILGKQAFYGLDFYISPDVLIPRPETELLVEEAIEWLNNHSQSRSMIDVGTGAGIIPVSLVDNIPDLTAVAIDISPMALEVARKNIEKYNLQNKITLLENDLLTDVEFKADLLTANLPYIPHDRLDSLEVARHEPSLALDGGIFGFDIIKRLLAQLPGHMKPGGLALLEIDFLQSDLAIETTSKFLTSAKITVLNDLANLPRILRIQC